MLVRLITWRAHISPFLTARRRAQMHHRINLSNVHQFITYIYVSFEPNLNITNERALPECACLMNRHPHAVSPPVTKPTSSTTEAYRQICTLALEMECRVLGLRMCCLPVRCRARRIHTGTLVRCEPCALNAVLRYHQSHASGLQSQRWRKRATKLA